jgi:hypothetical protein
MVEGVVAAMDCLGVESEKEKEKEMGELMKSGSISKGM